MKDGPLSVPSHRPLSPEAPAERPDPCVAVSSASWPSHERNFCLYLHLKIVLQLSLKFRSSFKNVGSLVDKTLIVRKKFIT